MRLAAALAVLAVLPAHAADLPPPPAPGAGAEERLYLASAAPAAADDALGLLAARIDCVAFQRDQIAARIEAGLLARGWNGDAERLWRLEEALARFEAAHIRPMIDAGTQAEVLAAYVPAEEEEAARAHRCAAFGDRFTLRRVLG